MKQCTMIAVGLGSTALLCAGLTGCSSSGAPQSTQEPPRVEVAMPVEREITDYADFTARTAAVESVELRARVAGYLDKINFKAGALVEKGEVLFEIDPRTYEAQVERAASHVAANEAAVRQAKADNVRAKNIYKMNPGAISVQELDKYQSTEDHAIASLAAAKAALHTDELNLGFTKIAAPISGRVSRYKVTVGNLVQAGDVTGGTLLTTIVSVDPIYAYFDVDENTVLRVVQMISQGKAKARDDVDIPVWLGLANEEGHPHRGTINFIDNQVNPRTGTLKVRGVFANADEALMPGYFARLRVPIGNPHNAVLITDRSLDSDLGQRVVYVVDEKDQVITRPVRLGDLHDGLREVTEGLKPGERVIVNGLLQVRPGMTVSPTLVDMPNPTLARRSAKPALVKVAPNP